ncbi:MAG TPA: inorganic phosphate transporter [Spirochaetota bacterium]|nr:inorganic phosphate transporter [Spirochaetota bacterium]
MYRLLAGVYLGWGLGANDAANVFSTGVATGVVRYRTAIFLTAVFVMIGAYVEGARGIATYESSPTWISAARSSLPLQPQLRSTS